MAGNESIARMLLDHKCSVNACVAETGWTALMMAVLNNHLNIVQVID